MGEGWDGGEIPTDSAVTLSAYPSQPVKGEGWDGGEIPTDSTVTLNTYSS